MPDVFVWMICDKKRRAYTRVPAKDLLSATQDDMQGKHCGKIQTLFLRVSPNVTRLFQRHVLVETARNRSNVT